MDAVNEVKNTHTLQFAEFRTKLQNKYKKYEDDSKLVEAKYQEEVKKYDIALKNFQNYYPSHGVRAPHLVRREMSAAKGEKKLELAREYRKAFRLWNRRPEEPTHPTGSAVAWLQDKRNKQKTLIKEREQEMVKRIQTDLLKLDEVLEEEAEKVIAEAVLVGC